MSSKSTEKDIKDFLKKGGKINKFYLANPRHNPGLVFFKKWYRGKNILDAIKRALSAE